jgi:hypothetical protein
VYPSIQLEDILNHYMLSLLHTGYEKLPGWIHIAALVGIDPPVFQTGGKSGSPPGTCTQSVWMQLKGKD